MMPEDVSFKRLSRLLIASTEHVSPRESVYGMSPRVCQSHIAQAISRWMTDTGAMDGDGRPSVSPALKADMLDEFVVCVQRAQKTRPSP